MRIRKLCCFSLVLVLCLSLTSQSQAIDPDFFKVPTDSKDGKELLEFMLKIANTPAKSQEELDEIRAKGFPAIEVAGEAIFALGDKADPTALKQAKNFLFQVRFGQFKEVDRKKQQYVIDYIASEMVSNPQMISQAIMVGGLAASTGDYQFAQKTYDQFITALKDGNSPFAEQALPTFEGAKAFVSLPGNKAQLSGKYSDGSEFSWEEYKGKVVFIDYWATWCPPCVAEIPHLKKLYEKYHEKGLEIISINLNENKKELTDFLAKTPYPWKTIFDAENGEVNADRYGISPLPASILIGKDGKVVALNVFEEELDKELEKLFK